MKNRYWIILGTIILALGGYWFYNNQSEQKRITFETVGIERGDLEMIVSASGTLDATNSVEVGTQVSGVIEKVLVDFNDQVKKGQVIAQIDTRNLASTMEQATARALQAELQYAQRKRSYDFAKKYNSEGGKDLSILEAEASVEQIRSQMELSKRNFERYKNLFEDGVVSRVEFETSEADYLRLKANYAAANAMLNRANANVSNVDLKKSEDDLKSAKANYASAKADLKKAKINLDYAIIRAPIDGIVISRNIEVGQTVAATFQTPVLFTIANDLTKMEIEASIDEADIGYIKEGQPVSFSVDAYTEEIFKGKVEQIRLQPKVVANVVTYSVIVNANNDNLKLMPGMTANLDVLTAQRKNVLKAPIKALNFSPPTAYLEPWRQYLEEEAVAIKINNNNWKPGILWKVEDNQLVPKKIQIGMSDGSFSEIKGNNFTAGDQVVIGINDGTKSTVSENTNLFVPKAPGAKK